MKTLLKQKNEMLNIRLQKNETIENKFHFKNY